jgi:hypothetical protein
VYSHSHFNHMHNVDTQSAGGSCNISLMSRGELSLFPPFVEKASP